MSATDLSIRRQIRGDNRSTQTQGLNQGESIAFGKRGLQQGPSTVQNLGDLGIVHVLNDVCVIECGIKSCVYRRIFLLI